MKPPSVPKKQTQSKPVLSVVEWANFKRKDSLHKQCYLLYLKGSFVMGHLGRHWQTKPKVLDELLRKVVEKC